MVPKQKKSKLLPNPLAFYIKLYCSRKGSTKTKYGNNLTEALNSWLSLSESEKQQFQIKYNNYKEKYKANIFSQLKNAEPFMKIKSSSKKFDSANDNLKNNENSDHLDELPQHIALESETQETEDIADTTEHITFDQEEAQDCSQDRQGQNEIEATNESNKPTHITLIEPLPPVIKTGHELYCILNTTDETENATWASLPRFEKHRYSRAVSIMKKDYISKYKEYLTSLSDKELFDYYNKNIF